jgi:hypothetical protein
MCQIITIGSKEMHTIKELKEHCKTIIQCGIGNME